MGKLLRKGIFTSVSFSGCIVFSKPCSPVPIGNVARSFYLPNETDMLFSTSLIDRLISLLHCFHRHRKLLK